MLQIVRDRAIDSQLFQLQSIQGGLKLFWVVIHLLYDTLVLSVVWRLSKSTVRFRKKRPQNIVYRAVECVFGLNRPSSFFINSFKPVLELPCTLFMSLFENFTTSQKFCTVLLNLLKVIATC